MRRPGGNYTEEVWERLREFYLANPQFDLTDIAAASAQICGKEVAYADLKARATNWDIERNQLDAAPEKDVASEVNHIRRIVYEQIIAASQNGLMLVGDFDRQEVMVALNGIKNLKIVTMRPGGVDAQMVNAYMNLLQKSNVRLDLGIQSGKTSREQVMDLSQQAKDELDEYYRSVSAAN